MRTGRRGIRIIRFGRSKLFVTRFGSGLCERVVRPAKTFLARSLAFCLTFVGQMGEFAS
jgi:hypothetical protein